MFDYRKEDSPDGSAEQHSRFGAPVSSVEIKLVGGSDADVGQSEPVGKLVVSGPAVAGGEWESGRTVKIGEDGCLGFVG